VITVYLGYLNGTLWHEYEDCGMPYFLSAVLSYEGSNDSVSLLVCFKTDKVSFMVKTTELSIAVLLKLSLAHCA